MTKSATGFLETNNLTSAIEAADQMLKAANLNHIEKIDLGASITTILIKGDAPSVEAALKAGESASKRSGGFLCAHMITDFNPEVEKYFLKGIEQ
ncbi:MAG: BMC domain-containing protein [Ignavibacteriaceae bacterium]|nr:BMC domain-containing protein [Ignavibacteriaceae bacterium]